MAFITYADQVGKAKAEAKQKEVERKVTGMNDNLPQKTNPFSPQPMMTNPYGAKSSPFSNVAKGLSPTQNKPVASGLSTPKQSSTKPTNIASGLQVEFTEPNRGANELSYIAETGFQGFIGAIDGLKNLPMTMATGWNKLVEPHIEKLYQNVLQDTTSPVLREALEKRKPIEERYKEIVNEKDWFDNQREEYQQKWKDVEITKEGRFVGDVAQGAMQMIPMIASNTLVAGSGLYVMFGQVFSRSFEEAVADGANIEEATTFGILNGAIEAGTEMLFGGIIGMGAGKLTKPVTKLATNGIGRFSSESLKRLASSDSGKALVAKAIDIFGEGAEEYLAEILGSATYGVYKDLEKSAVGTMLDTAWSKEAGYSFLVGTATSAFMQLGNYGAGKGILKMVEGEQIGNLPVSEQLDLVQKFADNRGIDVELIQDTNTTDNGFYDATENKIYINTLSKRPADFILKHEFTHSLSKTEGFDELKMSLLRGVYTNDQFIEKYTELEERYKNRLFQMEQDKVGRPLTEAETDAIMKKIDREVNLNYITEEMFADVVGERLFTDADSIIRLSRRMPDKFDAIKNQLKVYGKQISGTKMDVYLAKIEQAYDAISRVDNIPYPEMVNTHMMQEQTTEPSMAYSLSKTGISDRAKSAFYNIDFMRNENILNDEQFVSFLKDNPQDFGIENIEDLELEDIEGMWRSATKELALRNLNPIDSMEEVDSILYNNIPKNVFDNWFINADSTAKPRLEKMILSNPEVYNASLNRAWQEITQYWDGGIYSNMSFEDFINMDIKMFRGTRREGRMTEDDVFIAFSPDIEIARKFAGNNGVVEQITVKPKDTYGMLNPTGEFEMLVPRSMYNIASKKHGKDILGELPEGRFSLDMYQNVELETDLHKHLDASEAVIAQYDSNRYLNIEKKGDNYLVSWFIYDANSANIFINKKITQDFLPEEFAKSKIVGIVYPETEFARIEYEPNHTRNEFADKVDSDGMHIGDTQLYDKIKDTKLRNGMGNILVTYPHNGLGMSMGFGFYVSTMDKSTSRNKRDDKMYVNMENPLDFNKEMMTDEQGNIQTGTYVFLQNLFKMFPETKGYQIRGATKKYTFLEVSQILEQYIADNNGKIDSSVFDRLADEHGLDYFKFPNRLVDIMERANKAGEMPKNFDDLLLSKGYDAIIGDNTNFKVLDGQKIFSARNNIRVLDTMETLAKKDPDITREIDSRGNYLRKGIVEYFRDSKARNSIENLHNVFHGTTMGEFYEFDRSKAQLYNNFGKGFYFTTNSTDVDSNYVGGGADFEAKVSKFTDRIMDENPRMDYDDAEKQAREMLYVAPNLLSGYVRIENPAYAGETNVFDFGDFLQENYEVLDYVDQEYIDMYEEYLSTIEDQNEALDLVEYLKENHDEYYSDEVEFGMLNDAGYEFKDYIRDILWNNDDSETAIVWGQDEVLDKILQASMEYHIGEGEPVTPNMLNSIFDGYVDSEIGEYSAGEMTRKILEYLDYDGIIDNTVYDKFRGMTGISPNTVHYITFESNQFKNDDNYKPSLDPDIRYSLDAETISYLKNHSYRKTLEFDLERNLKPQYLEQHKVYEEMTLDTASDAFWNEYDEVSFEGFNNQTPQEAFEEWKQQKLTETEQFKNDYMDVVNELQDVEYKMIVTEGILSRVPKPLEIDTSNQSASVYLTYPSDMYQQVVDALPFKNINTETNELGETFDVRIADQPVGYYQDSLSGKTKQYKASDIEVNINDYDNTKRFSVDPDVNERTVIVTDDGRSIRLTELYNQTREITKTLKTRRNPEYPNLHGERIIKSLEVPSRNNNPLLDDFWYFERGIEESRLSKIEQTKQYIRKIQSERGSNQTHVDNMTAEFDTVMMVDSKWLNDNVVDGMHGELSRLANKPSVTDKAKIEYLANDMNENGFNIVRPITVVVDAFGDAYIHEGNHRLETASRLGIPVWMELKYYDHSEHLEDGRFYPDTFTEIPQTMIHKSLMYKEFGGYKAKLKVYDSWKQQGFDVRFSLDDVSMDELEYLDLAEEVKPEFDKNAFLSEVDVKAQQEADFRKTAEDVIKQRLSKEQLDASKNLIAMHSTSLDNIQAILDLGGIPSPSVAITKDTLLDEALNFGQATILLKPESVNPESNFVLGRDAYSPTRPDVYFRTNKEVRMEIDAFFDELEIQKNKYSESPELSKRFADLQQYTYNYLFELQKQDSGYHSEKYTKEIMYNHYIRNVKSISDITHESEMKPYIEMAKALADKSISKKYLESNSGKYLPFSLENIVNAMYEADPRGKEGGKPFNMDGIIAQLTKPFKNMSELKEQSAKTLNKYNQEYYKLEGKVEGIFSTINKFYRTEATHDNFYGTNFGIEILYRTIKRYGEVTPENLKSVLESDDFRYKLNSMVLLEEAVENINKMLDMPVEYYEAKLNRVVSLNEIYKVLLPMNMTKPEIKEGLRKRGIEFEEYPSMELRKMMVKYANDVKFSIDGEPTMVYSDTLEKKKTRNIRFDDMREEYKLRKEPFDRATVDKALEEVQGKHPRNSSIRTKEEWIRVAQRIGQYNKGATYEDIKVLASKAWYDIRPNMKERLNREGKKFVRFDVVDWTNGMIHGAEITPPDAVYVPKEVGEVAKVVEPTIRKKKEKSRAIQFFDSYRGEKPNGFNNLTPQEREDFEFIANIPFGIDGTYLEPQLEALLSKMEQKTSDDVEYLMEQRKLIDERKNAQPEAVEVALEEESATEAVVETTDTETVAEVVAEESPHPKPPRIDDGTKVRQFAESAVESGNLDAITEDTVEAMIERGELNYTPVGNIETLSKAYKQMDKSFDKAYNEFMVIVESNRRITSQDVTLGEVLLKRAVEDGDSKRAVELITTLSIIGTELGQAVQSMALVKKLSPEGQLLSLRKTINRLDRKYTDRKIRKYNGIVLNEALVEQFIKAETQEQRNDVIDAIKQDTADQLPVTFFDQVNAWRYLSMLGNLKTHNRNVLGNLLFMPMKVMKDVIGTGFETMFVSKENRTKSLVSRLNKNDAVYLDSAKNDYSEIEKILESGAKYDMGTDIEMKRTVFKSNNKILSPIMKGLEKARVWNFKALEWGDAIFLKRHYINTFAQYIKARGLDYESMTTDEVNIAREHAINEAKRMTFRDVSNFATLLYKIENSSNTGRFMIGAVIPFKKTPTNILKRGFEYSPMGLLNNVTRDVQRLGSGKINSTEFIERISRGLTGTSITVLGAMLASMGVINIEDDDDSKKEKYYKNMFGMQRYSINAMGGTFSIDWLVPFVIPLIIGAEIQHQLETDKDESLANVAFDAMADIFDPVFELTMLDGVVRTAKSFAGSSSAFAGEALQSSVESYIGQFFPTLGSQIAKIIDPVRRTTEPSSTGFEGRVERFTNYIMTKVPMLSQMNEPMLNVRGEEIRQVDNVLARSFLNMISPSYYNTGTPTVQDYEIQEVYNATKNDEALPKITPKNFTYDGQKFQLSGEEKTTFGKIMGERSYELLETLFETPDYQSASDEEKVKLIGDVYKYSYNDAKSNVLMEKGLQYDDTWYNKIDNAVSVELNPSQYIVAKKLYDDTTESAFATRKVNYIQNLSNSGYSREQTVYLMENVAGYVVDEKTEKLLNELYGGFGTGFKFDFDFGYMKKLRGE